MKKILHISHSATNGGAAIACVELHKALLERGVDSEVWCASSNDKDIQRVSTFETGFLSKLWVKWLKFLAVYPLRLIQFTKNPNVHTLDIFSLISAEDINASDADIVHLHWVNFNTLSIAEVTKIKKPIVWTQHDLWYVLGCEHHDSFDSPGRFIQGYSLENSNVSGVDVNRIIWQKKRKLWENFTPTLITPSNWLSEEVKKSALYRNEPILAIPNIVRFSKRNSTEASIREIKPSRFTVLIGAYNLNDRIKGGHFVKELIHKFKDSNVQFALFGNVHKGLENTQNVNQLGYLRTPEEIQRAYLDSDLVLVPSMNENLPNIALEALYWHKPVVAFEIGGLPDLVVHKETGYLARPFNVQDLMNGVNFVRNQRDKINFEANAEEHFEKHFSKEIIVDRTLEVYDSLLNNKNGK